MIKDRANNEPFLYLNGHPLTRGALKFRTTAAKSELCMPATAQLAKI